MSVIPIASRDAGRPSRSASPTRSPARRAGEARYGDQEVSQFRGAEMIAEKWDITRDDMEEFALESHAAGAAAPSTRAASSARSSPLGGRHRRRGPAPRHHAREDAVAADARRGRPAHRRGAPARSPTRSAAMLIASEQAVKDARPTPRARIHHLSVRGDDPICMLTAPIPATAHALDEGRHDARRHRPGRDQRGVRLGRARLAEGDRRRPGARSTSTAARSRSATRSAPPAPG